MSKKDPQLDTNQLHELLETREKQLRQMAEMLGDLNTRLNDVNVHTYRFA